MLSAVAYAVGWGSAWVRSLFCFHKDDMRHTEKGRIFLRCPDCGRETPGWRVK